VPGWNSNYRTLAKDDDVLGGRTTYIRESNPKDANNNGEVPMTEHMRAIVRAVVDPLLLMVDSRAEAPMIRSKQNMTRRIHPEDLVKPWRAQR
jgi:hypothetical protein